MPGTFREHYVDELRDLYDAEKQILTALPKMAQAATHAELRKAFEMHLRQTEGQVARLDKIFGALGEQPTGKKCVAMAGLIKEGDELLKEGLEPDVLDAALIGAAQKVEHYEIAGYGTARTWAKRLGEQEACMLLQQTLEEEAATDEKLTKLAEPKINKEAMAAAA
jgi:ferritin-like metal-binding protein YciE